MFKIRIAKEKASVFLKESRILRPLMNSRDLLIPLRPLRKARDKVPLSSEAINSVRQAIVSFVRKGYADARKNKIGFINRVLVLSCLVLLLLLALEFAKPRRLPTMISAEEPPGHATSTEMHTQPRPLAYYSQEIANRQLFQLDPELQTRSTSDKSQKSNIALAKLAENLVLLGITLDHEPRAIIEDQREKKTYFLGVGEFIGPIRVQEILKGKVILGYEDERLDLVL